MAASVVYAIALFLAVGVVFLVIFFALFLVFAYFHDLLRGKKTEDDDYGPVIGQQIEFFPKAFRAIFFLSLILAALPAIPVTLWAFKSIGWTAPWLTPPPTDEYWKKIAEAEEQYKQAIAQYDALTGQSRDELQKARSELADAQRALVRTQELIQEEFNRVPPPQSESSWPWWSPLVLTYLAGVVQSALGSALYEMLKKRKK